MSYVNIPSYAWKEPVATSGDLPLIGNSDGDARIVLSDNTLRIWDEGTSSWILSSGGTGDVAGPASSTDNAVVRFDSTTGKLIQNSTATLSDLGAFLAGNGTAALPSYSFSSNADLGVYRSAADTLAFSTAGVNRGSINSTGGWTLGTTNTGTTHVVFGDIQFSEATATSTVELYRAGTTGLIALRGDGGGTPSSLLIYGSGHATLPGYTRFQNSLGVTLQIDDAGKIIFGVSGGTQSHDLNGNLRIDGNLGIGNSAAATTLGNVVAKAEIFDASGVSLGFMPVYDSIT